MYVNQEGGFIKECMSIYFPNEASVFPFYIYNGETVLVSFYKGEIDVKYYYKW